MKAREEARHEEQQQKENEFFEVWIGQEDKVRNFPPFPPPLSPPPLSLTASPSRPPCCPSCLILLLIPT